MPENLEPVTADRGPWLQTPSQTIGPFYGYALPYAGDSDIAPTWHPDAVRVHGTVFDGAGVPVPDALIELWHADADGRVIRERGSLERDGHTVTGFGRASTDRAGHYSFTTIKPGATRADAAPYMLVCVFARGLLHHLFTRAYFADEPERNDADRFLASLDPARRATLIAALEGDRGYRFDIRLQGDGETVFLDFDGEA